jgi:hypothetical protein
MTHGMPLSFYAGLLLNCRSIPLNSVTIFIDSCRILLNSRRIFLNRSRIRIDSLCQIFSSIGQFHCTNFLGITIDTDAEARTIKKEE